jgi:hypothetical protein
MFSHKEKGLTSSSMLRCISVPRDMNEVLEKSFATALETSMVNFCQGKMRRNISILSTVKNVIEGSECCWGLCGYDEAEPQGTFLPSHFNQRGS